MSNFIQHVMHCNNQMSLDMLYEALDILERLFYNSQVDFFEYTNAFIGINSGISQILEQYNCPTTFNI